MEALNFMEPVISRLVEDCSETELEKALNISNSVHSSYESLSSSPGLSMIQRQSLRVSVDSRVLQGIYLYRPGIRHCDKVIRCLLVLKTEWKAFQQWCEQFVRSRQFNVCCIGDGSGVEAIGLVLGMDDILRNGNRNNRQRYVFDKIKITACQMDHISDDFDEMNTLYSELLTALRRKIHASKLASVLSGGHTVIDADYPINTDAKEALHYAALVTLVTCFQGTQESTFEMKRIIKNIASFMKPGSLLFLISETDMSNLSAFKATLSSRDCGLRLIHNRKLTFKMSEAVIEKFGRELFNLFKIPPVQDYTVVMMVWQKVASMQRNRANTLPNIRPLESTYQIPQCNDYVQDPISVTKFTENDENFNVKNFEDAKDCTLNSSEYSLSAYRPTNQTSRSSKQFNTYNGKNDGRGERQFYGTHNTVSRRPHSANRNRINGLSPVGEHVFKILVVGDIGTGKTSLISRYVYSVFPINYVATLGVEFALKVVEWDPNTLIRLQLWDIAGQEGFQHMTRVYYKEADGAVVVFDVSRPPTLDAVVKWKMDLDNKVCLNDGTRVPCILLGNKSDLPMEGTVSNPRYIDKFCQENGFTNWFLTSAKGGMNVDEAMRFLVAKILENQKAFHAESRDANSISLQRRDLRKSREPCSKTKCCSV